MSIYGIRDTIRNISEKISCGIAIVSPASKYQADQPKYKQSDKGSAYPKCNLFTSHCKVLCLVRLWIEGLMAHRVGFSLSIPQITKSAEWTGLPRSSTNVSVS